jgi:hypothetical protein
VVDRRVREATDRARRLGLKETSPASFADQHVEIFQAVVDGDLPSAPAARCASHLRAVFGRTSSAPAALTGAVRRGRSARSRCGGNVVVWE